MIIEFENNLHKEYPIGSLWEDAFSYKEDDQKSDYYVMFDNWKFIGRFKDFGDAMRGAFKNDN